MHREDLISIWFFIGVLLLFYGVVIFGAGVYDLAASNTGSTALAELHPPVWWGALLLAVGGFYSWHFKPGRRK